MKLDDCYPLYKCFHEKTYESYFRHSEDTEKILEHLLFSHIIFSNEKQIESNEYLISTHSIADQRNVDEFR